MRETDTASTSVAQRAQALLDRIATENERIRAYVTVDRAAVLREAARLDALPAAERGPLHGMTLAVKDIIDVAGLPTRAGSSFFERLPEGDAPVVRALRAAGALVVGKTNTHEFAWGITTENPHTGRTANPWNLAHSAGGSSGGSGAALAAGLADFALGTDTQGSIRIPGALCGVSGLRPATGSIAMDGIVPLAPGLDTVGPMAWTARDCAILLDALAGHDPADPASVAVPRIAYARAVSAPVKGLRVGLLRRHYEREVPAAPETLRMMAEATRVLRDLGCRIGEASLPPVSEFNAVGRVIICAEAYALHEATLKTRLADYSRVFRIRVMAGALIRAADYIAAQRRRSDLIAQAAAAFEKFDVLVSVPTPGAAPLLTEQRPDEGFAQPFLTTLANVAAVPALVVCGGFTAQGLPLGIEFIGPAWAEARLLRIGHHFEHATGTRRRRPPPP